MKKGSNETLNTKEYVQKAITETGKKMYPFFEMLRVDIEEYKEIIHKAIDSVKTSWDKRSDFKVFYERKLKELLREITEEKIKDKNNLPELLKKILAKNLSNPDSSYMRAIVNVNKIGKYAKDFGIPLSEDVLQQLLENKIISDSLEIIFKKHEHAIKTGRVDEIYSSEAVISLIGLYCLKNNIEIEEQDEPMDEIDKMAMPNEVNQYIREASKFPLLTKEEEQDLSTKYKNGDTDAFEKLVNHNLRLVISIVKKCQCHTSTSMSFMDLIQEGNLGLLTAARKFDASKGYRFSTYATWWIRQSIYRGIYDNGSTIRKPVHIHERLSTFNKKVEALYTELGREPTVEEIAERLNISTKKVCDFLSYQMDPVSLDQPVGDGYEDDSELGQFIPSEDNTENSALTENIWEKAKNELLNIGVKGKHIEIFERRMGLNGNEHHTLDEVGKEYHVTSERIRQIEAKVLTKLRQPRFKRLFSEDLEPVATKPQKNNNSEYQPSVVVNQPVVVEAKRKKTVPIYEETIEELLNDISSITGIKKIDFKIYLYRIGAYDDIRRSNKKVADFFEVPSIAINKITCNVRNALKRYEECAKPFHYLKVRIEEQDSKDRENDLEAIKEELNNMGRKMQPMLQMLGCTKEELEQAYEKLTDEEKELYQKRNGSDIDNPVSTLTPEEKVKFSGVLRILRILIENPNYIRRQKKEVNEEVTVVVLQDQITSTEPDSQGVDETISQQTGDVPHEQDKSPEREKHEVQLPNELPSYGGTIEPVVENEATSNEITKEDAIGILNIIKSPSMKEMLESLPSDTAIIAMLRFGYFQNKYFSIESIANFLDVPQEDVRGAIRDSLTIYRDYAVSLIDKAIANNELSNNHGPLLEIK